jgi:hypothetical protein
MKRLVNLVFAIFLPGSLYAQKNVDLIKLNAYHSEIVKE